jgi:hypothetical protein
MAGPRSFYVPSNSHQRSVAPADPDKVYQAAYLMISGFLIYIPEGE